MSRQEQKALLTEVAAEAAWMRLKQELDPRDMGVQTITEFFKGRELQRFKVDSRKRGCSEDDVVYE